MGEKHYEVYYHPPEPSLDFDLCEVNDDGTAEVVAKFPDRKVAEEVARVLNLARKRSRHRP